MLLRIMLAVLLFSVIAPARAETLQDLIVDFDRFSAAKSPESAARASQSEPMKWATVTPEYYAERAAQASVLRQRLDSLTIAEAGPEAAILRHLLDAEINAHTHDLARIPFTGDWGFYAVPTFAAMRTRANTKERAEAWISRVDDIPRFFAEHTLNMRRGIATQWTQHGDPLRTSMDQIAAQLFNEPTLSPLYLPFESLSASSLSDAEIAALEQRGAAAVRRALQAYGDLYSFLQNIYTPAARQQPGLASLQYGQAVYAIQVAHFTAGAGYSAADIHQIGLSEVARIRGEMNAIITEVAFNGSFAAFIEFLRTDPQFYAKTPEELLEKAAEMSKRLDALLPRYFKTLPRLPYGVEAVPASIAPGYTTGRYSGGDAEKGIAGTYLVNTYALDQRPLYELPALSAHEAVPGHHLQIALAQELQDVPNFRKSYYATAFGEGWGLYAEKLVGEADFYRTPYERFGQLSYEMWRACRLVADTGLHYYNWSREQAEACFLENTALSPLNIKTEVTRYIGWPGQAVAYKVGELKILELRAAAETALGEEFDIREFHDVVLGAGSMPLNALQDRIVSWIMDSQKAAD